MEEDLSLKLGMLEMGDESSLDQHPVHDQADEQNQQSSENCNLIVNYLPHDIDDLALKGLFVEFGEIVMAKVVTDRTTKKSLGYGFVKFLREDDAKMAIQRLNGFTIDHKCLKVSVARPPSLEIKNCKLYVTNLPRDYSENEVINLFKEFGEIIECRVLKDRNARSNKGVAFVQFDNKAQANNALSLNGCQLEGSTRGLVVKYAEDQHKKREMTRLQSLTSHNVYRYMTPGTMPPPPQMQMQMDPSADPSKAGRGRDKQEALAASYYYPSPQQQQVQQQQQQQHGGHGVPQQHVQQQQQQHGLGGINAIYGGAGQLHHLQVPTITVQNMQGGGLPSPIMGSVSPNHYLYQQQQMLQQQQQQIPMPGPPSPMMGFSPGGMRRVKGGKGIYDLQIQPEQQQQYGQWYSQPGQQQQMYLGATAVSPVMHSPQHHLHMQQRQLQSQLQGQPVDLSQFNAGMGGMLSVNTGGGGGMNQLGLNQGNQSPLMRPMTYHQQAPHQQYGQQQQQYSPLGGNLQTFQSQHSGQLQPSQQMHASVYQQQHQQQQQVQQQQQGGGHLQTGPYAQPIHDGVPKNGAYSNPYQHQGSGSVTLNITNLPANADVAMLHELFGPYGRILSAQIDVDTSPQAKPHSGGTGGGGGAAGRVSVCSGRGRVQLADMAQAQGAVQALNGSAYRSDVPIQVSIAGSGLSGTK